MDTASPNGWQVLIVLIQSVVTLAGMYFTYRATIGKVASKEQVNEVHKTVNGNLHAEQKKVQKYSSKLRELGVEPDEL